MSESSSKAPSETLDQYGVIGHPVEHSWSPFIHGQFARQTGQALAYRLHDVPPERFRVHVADFAEHGGRGLNVTVPHKLAAARLSSELTGRAQRAGAVNTLVLEADRILGDNTDGAGLVRDLVSNLGLELADRRILIAGAGGAARGVLSPLLALGPAQILVAARVAARARSLVDEFAVPGHKLAGCGFEELPCERFDLVLNATSASLNGQVPALSQAVIGPATLCYDMAYARTDTAFVRWARERGCERAVQGWGMLVEQAAESFQLWRGIRPDTAPVLAQLTAGRRGSGGGGGGGGAGGAGAARATRA